MIGLLVVILIEIIGARLELGRIRYIGYKDDGQYLLNQIDTIIINQIISR